VSPSHASASTRASTSPSTAPPRPTSSPPASVSDGAPLIVIDPGHSVTVHATDPATGLDVSDYENEPEMRDVFAVAELVRTLLRDDGYRVIFTKPTLDTPTSLGRRAEVANAAHAALALSIHDQAGSAGIGFTQGNNVVYYQSLGDYRETPAGRKVYFTDSGVAALSKRYGQIFQAKRSAVLGVPVTLLGNTGYDLGSRGLPAGDIWLVQLLAHVPWIYNEAGGNSAGMIGLSPADEQRYARSLALAVEACVPIRH
jgi:N-acetylmuramoyl-L-alanine amidase